MKRRLGDFRSVEAVDIYRNADRMGRLSRTAEGSRFEYEKTFFDAHRHLPGGPAVQLPFSERVLQTSGVNLHPYFAGLLPEGLRLRSLLARSRTSEDDLFTLLVAGGSDCVGDLFPVLPGAKPAPLLNETEERSPLDQISFTDVLARSLDSYLEPSVPGVQDKLSPSVISLPFATRGKRWILKLNPADKPFLVENEFFCMALAKACGLDTAVTHLVRDRDGAAGLLSQRFDRQRVGRVWRGLHQEDACQFLNKYPSEKYRLTTAEAARGLSVCDAPAVECARLLELVAFSYLIGNGDLHGKNISIGVANGALQMTPAYDLLSTRPYQDQHLAIQFEGRDANLKRRTFLEFGARFGVTAKAVEERLDRLVHRAKPLIPELSGIGFDPRTTKVLAELMKKRSADLSG